MIAAGEEMSWFNIMVVDCGLIGWILWALSFVTIGIIIEHFIAIRRINIMPEMLHMQVRDMFDGKQYRDVIEVTAEDPSFLGYVIHAALSEAPHGYPAMERAMEEAAEERTTKLLRHIEWLNLLGNIGPMLGLMGTVWGMIMAFFDIVKAGGMPNPGALAGSIGTALVTTLLGLIVAIPAMAVYGIMRNKIDSLASEAIMASQELISTFRPSRKGE